MAPNMFDGLFTFLLVAAVIIAAVFFGLGAWIF